MGIKNAIHSIAMPEAQMFTGYHAFGGTSATASEQANSLSQAHQDAGIILVHFTLISKVLWRDIFPQIFDTFQ